MSRSSKITITQFICILFLSRIVVNITYNPYLSGSGEMIDHILSCVVSFVITSIMFIPIYFMYKKYDTLNLIDDSYYLLGKFGVVVAILFALYFLLVSIYSLSLYTVFMNNVIMPDMPILVVCVAVTIVSVYAAFRGIEGLARASTLLLVLSLISIIFLICTLIPHVDTLNYTPLLYDGNHQFLQGVNIMISRTSCIALIAVFIPYLKKGNLKAGFITWNAGVYLLMILLILSIVGSQGDFLKTHVFPIYAAFNDASIGFLKRLDVFYLGIWTTGLFVKISINMLAFSICISKIFGEKYFKTIAALGGVIIAVSSIIIASTSKVELFTITSSIPICITLFISLIIPTILLIIDSVKQRRKKVNE